MVDDVVGGTFSQILYTTGAFVWIVVKFAVANPMWMIRVDAVDVSL